jgi:hypothetical protein
MALPGQPRQEPNESRRGYICYISRERDLFGFRNTVDPFAPDNWR